MNSDPDIHQWSEVLRYVSIARDSGLARERRRAWDSAADAARTYAKLMLPRVIAGEKCLAEGSISHHGSESVALETELAAIFAEQRAILETLANTTSRDAERDLPKLVQQWKDHGQKFQAVMRRVLRLLSEVRANPIKSPSLN